MLHTAQRLAGSCVALPCMRHTVPGAAVLLRTYGADTSTEADGATVRRLLYRARQRGFLELDLLVGGWAAAQLPHMDKQRRAALEELLQQENPDLFQWLTGQQEPPPEVAGNSAFAELRADVAARLQRSAAGAAAPQGAAWRRGWDDSARQEQQQQQQQPHGP